PAQSSGPFTGIAQVAYDHGVVGLTSGTSAPEAESSEFVVVMVGFTPGDEGEEYTIPSGGDRASLDLPGSQAQLVNDVLMLDKPTVIVVQSGSIVNTPWLTHPNQKQATVWAGYGGMRGGAALGKLLFGDANFGGKLPIVWPAQNSLPAFKDQPNATSMSYFVGYRYYDRRAVSGGEPELVFPFGHGLSYTTFAYSNPVVPCAEVSSSAVLEVTVDVTNTGAVRGDEVAFLFVAGPESSGTGQRSVKELKSFERVSLSPGETRTVRLPVRIQDLRHWEGGESGRWVVDAGTYSLLVGPSAASEDLVLAGTFTVAD
ncbi:MAG TPA: glycoside hydrolase family 3 C-terminal domain-containing protein, partial [Polyangiaceae bacterium]